MFFSGKMDRNIWATMSEMLNLSGVGLLGGFKTQESKTRQTFKRLNEPKSALAPIKKN